MSKKIGVLIALDGEKQFVQGLRNAQASTRVLKSDLSGLASEYKNNANSLEYLTKRQEKLKDAQASYERVLSQAKNGRSNALKQLNEQREALEDLRKQLDKAKDAQRQMEASGDRSSQSYKDQCAAVKDLEEAVQAQNNEYLRAEGRMTSWDLKVSQAERSVRENSKALEQNEKYMKEAQQATDHCATSIDKFGKETDDAKNSTQELGVSLGTMIKAKAVDLAGDAMRELGRKALEAAKYVIEVGSNFEKAMSEVEAISGAIGTELDAMSEKAQALGSTTKFSATEVAQGFKYMSLAGWSTQEMLSGIDGVVNLAAASEMDLASASDMVTDYLSAFGLAASDAGKMADQMAFAQANSNTTVEMLGESFGNCAANMHAAGQDMETTTSFLEAMANQGRKGAQAGTTLSAIMRDLTAKMKDGKVQIGDTAVAIQDSEGNYRDLTDIMRDVESATEGMGTAQRTTALSATFTSRSIAGVNMILTEGVDKIAGYEEKLRSADGTAAAMAGTMQNNLQGAITEMNSAAEGLGIALYNKVNGPLTDAVRLATDLISGITEAINPEKTALEQFIADAAQMNEQAKASVENANSAIAAGEAEVAKLDSLSSIIKDANEQFTLFSEIDTSPVAVNVEGTASGISDSSDNIQNSAEEIKTALSMEGVDSSAASSDVGDTAADINESTTQIQNDAAAAKEKIEEIGNAQLSVENLQAELGQIRDAMSSANSEMDEFTKFKVRSAVQELAQSIPAIGEAWDEVTGTLKLTEQQFDNLVNAQKRSVMEATLVKAQADAMQGVADATVAQAMAQSALNNIYEEAGQVLDEITGETGHVVSSYEDLYREWENHPVLYDLKEAAGDARDELEEANGTLEAATETEQRVREATEGLAESYGFASEQAEQAASSTEQVVEKTEEQIQAEADLAKEVYTAQKEIAQAHKEAADEITQAYDSAKEAAENAFSVNPFDAWSQDTESGIEKMQSAFESQIEGMATYEDNLRNVSEHVGKEITPEFLHYLESLGTEGAQVMQELSDAFDDNDTEKVERLMQAYVDAMDQQDSISRALAADAVAFQLGLGEFSSTAEEWQGLDSAVTYVQQVGGEVTDATLTAFQEAEKAAQECGVKIPDGLAEGIESGSDDPETAIIEATQKLNAAIKGRADGLLKAAHEAGIPVPEEIAKGIEEGGDSVVTAYQSLIDLIASSNTEQAAAASKETGTGIGTGVVEGIEEEQGAAEGAAQSLTESAKDAAVSAATGFNDAGHAAVAGFQVGIGTQQSKAAEAAKTMATQGAEAAKGTAGEYNSAGSNVGSNFVSGLSSQAGNAYSAGSNVASSGQQGASSVGGWESIGSNMAAGIAAGIRAKAAEVASEAAKMVTDALAAAQAAQDSHSPSRKARDLIGKQFAAGSAMGIAQNTDLVTEEATAQMNQTLAATQKWLRKNKKKLQKAGAEYSEAITYAWQRLAKNELKSNFGISTTTTTGTGDKAKTENKTPEKYASEVYAAAQKYMANVQKLYTVSAKDELAYWKTVRSHLERGTQAWYDATDKIKDLQKTARENTKSEREKILSNAEKYVSTRKAQNKLSITEEIAYWKEIRSQLKKGSAEYKTATQHIREAKAQIGKVENAAILLENYQTYYKMSERAEMQYWKEIRKHYKAGTVQRILADKNYLSAREKYLSDLKELDDEYKRNKAEYIQDIQNAKEELQKVTKKLDADILSEEEKFAKKSESIQKKLTDNIEAANKKYADAVENRKKTLMGAFDLFSAFESKSDTGEQLLFNLKSQAEGYKDWVAELKKLQDRNVLSDALLQELTEKGPTNSAAIHALGMLSDAQLREYNAAYETKASISGKKAEEENTELLKSTNEEIEKLREDAVKEIQEARDETNKAIDSLKQQGKKDIAEATAAVTKAEKQLSDLKTTYKTERGELTKSINADILTLAKDVKSIVSDQTDALVAAFRAKDGLKSDAGGSVGKNVSTKTTGAVQATAEVKAADAAVKAQSEKDKLLEIIHSGSKRSKTLTAAEKAVHAPIWEYIAQKYGRTATNAMYKSLAAALKISVSSSVTGKQKNAILDALKKKGLRSGSRSVDDFFAWMDEEGIGSEMILRKSDRARLNTSVQPGDAIVPAQNTENLWRWSRTSPEEILSGIERQQAALESYSRELMSTVELSVLNQKLVSSQKNAGGRTEGDATDLMEQMLDLMERFLPYMAQKTQVNIDGRKLVSATSDYTSQELAMRSRRRR